ncbi:MAG: thioredoxin family protein [Desulfurivibrionaceae bacterium]|nr:thioredoxin family protein [Desulfobulbales bacterium]MDT8334595.1 thioredoxin family protein [Desulfurivibrionaceae bacterium]
MKELLAAILILLSLFTFTGCSQAGDSTDQAGEIVPGIPVKDTVTMVDLGAKTCVPCKMMAPILEELQEEYRGRAEVIFIDVWDPANEGKARAFKVMAIPTQIFYDREGKETFRHTGFFDKKSIAAKLDELLAQ